MFLTVICVLAAAVLGFVLGRVSVYKKVYIGGSGDEALYEESKACYGNEAEQEENGQAVNLGENGGRIRYYPDYRWRGEHRGYEKCGLKTWAVGSPVSGTVTMCREGEHPLLVIRPGEDRLYAPVGGKITRLYPLGNAFSFQTEFGTLLHIQVGEAKDELLGCYYRPRVIRNEVVNKGKLLLEFDRAALEAEGVGADVAVQVKNLLPGSSVRMTAGEYVKNGEEIFEVVEQMVTKVRV